MKERLVKDMSDDDADFQSVRAPLPKRARVETVKPANTQKRRCQQDPALVARVCQLASKHNPLPTIDRILHDEGRAA